MMDDELVSDSVFSAATRRLEEASISRVVLHGELKDKQVLRALLSFRLRDPSPLQPTNAFKCICMAVENEDC
eukprot:1527298-Pleurochrysis_carterae.AAC.1